MDGIVNHTIDFRGAANAWFLASVQRLSILPYRKGHSHFLYDRPLVEQYEKALSKLYSLDLDPLKFIIEGYYSHTGAPAEYQPELFRFFILMSELKIHSIPKWVGMLRNNQILAYMIGLEPSQTPCSEEWKQEMKSRTSSERVNKRLLNDYGLELSRTRGIKRIFWWSVVHSLNIHLDAMLKVSGFSFIKLLESFIATAA